MNFKSFEKSGFRKATIAEGNHLLQILKNSPGTGRVDLAVNMRCSTLQAASNFADVCGRFTGNRKIKYGIPKIGWSSDPEEDPHLRKNAKYMETGDCEYVGNHPDTSASILNRTIFYPFRAGESSEPVTKGLIQTLYLPPVSNNLKPTSVK